MQMQCHADELTATGYRAELGVEDLIDNTPTPDHIKAPDQGAPDWDHHLQAAAQAPVLCSVLLATYSKRVIEYIGQTELMECIRAPRDVKLVGLKKVRLACGQCMRAAHLGALMHHPRDCRCMQRHRTTSRPQHCSFSATSTAARSLFGRPT
jgi:hypothetical protein